ncbi:MAG: hypothetical protein Tsb0019_13860 [Roseibium sp.]
MKDFFERILGRASPYVWEDSPSKYPYAEHIDSFQNASLQSAAAMSFAIAIFLFPVFGLGGLSLTFLTGAFGVLLVAFAALMYFILYQMCIGNDYCISIRVSGGYPVVKSQFACYAVFLVALAVGMHLAENSNTYFPNKYVFYAVALIGVFAVYSLAKFLNSRILTFRPS